MVKKRSKIQLLAYSDSCYSCRLLIKQIFEAENSWLGKFGLVTEIKALSIMSLLKTLQLVGLLLISKSQYPTVPTNQSSRICDHRSKIQSKIYYEIALYSRIKQISNYCTF